MDERLSARDDSQSRTLQTYVLTPIEVGRETEASTFHPGQFIGAVWRWRFFIVLIPIMLAIAAVAFRRAGPDEYVATATLLIQRSPIRNELDPQSLSLETYDALLVSDPILSKVRSRLVDLGHYTSDGTLERLKKLLAVELVADKSVDRPGERSYLPILRLVARNETAQGAVASANVWAELFVEESRSLSTLRKGEALDFVENRFPDVAQSLASSEEELNNVTDDFSGRSVTLAKRWSQSLFNFVVEQGRALVQLRAQVAREEQAYKDQTDQLLSAHQLETDEMKRDYLSRWQREVRSDELKLKREKLADFKNREIDNLLEIESSRGELETLKKEIDQHPEFIVLSKAISDDALWEKLGDRSKEAVIRQLADVKFESQNINPLYQKLLSDLTKAKTDLQKFTLSAEYLQGQVKALESEVKELEDAFSAQRLGFDELVSRRLTDYNKLERARQVGWSILERENQQKIKDLEDAGNLKRVQLEADRDQQKAALDLDGKLSVEQVSRETANARTTYQSMAEKLEFARLARADEVAEVQFGLRAIQPEEPQPKQTMFWGAAAFLIGFFGIVSLALAWELGRPLLADSNRSASSSKLGSQPGNRVSEDRSAKVGRSLIGR